jgi:hypothetical protein
MQIGHRHGARELFGQGGGLMRPPADASVVDAAVLLTGEEGAPNNYHCTFVTGGLGSPRQRRTFEQIRLVLDGEYRLGDLVVAPGSVVYLPESVPFGPQAVGRDVEMVMIMMGGPSGLGFFSSRQRKAAVDGLLSRGAFVDGDYHTRDASGAVHIEDGYDALWAAITGKPTVFPPPRYGAPIVMRPQAASFLPDPTQSGVSRQILGTFTEREIKIGFVRLDAGATLTFGEEPAPEIAYLIRGAVAVDAVVHRAATAFGSAPAESPVDLLASEESELFYVKLATFSPA